MYPVVDIKLMYAIRDQIRSLCGGQQEKVWTEQAKDYRPSAFTTKP